MGERVSVTFSALMNGAHITENKKVLEVKEWLNRNLVTDVFAKLGCVVRMVVDSILPHAGQMTIGKTHPRLLCLS